MEIENTLKYDIHSHILPRLDDGSSSSEESVRMLSELWAQGVRCVIATPHFYPWNDEPEAFIERRASSFARLAEVMREHAEEKFPKVYIGAEVAFYRGIAKYEGLSNLCIIGTEYILIEMPFEKWSRLMVEEIVSIKTIRGFTPIIAHVERYLSYMDDSLLDMLIEAGCIIQGNSAPLLRFFEKRKVLELIKKGRIHVLGSDCHSMRSRAPHLAEASEIIKEKLGAMTVDVLNKKASRIFESALELQQLVEEENL